MLMLEKPFKANARKQRHFGATLVFILFGFCSSAHMACTSDQVTKTADSPNPYGIVLKDRETRLVSRIFELEGKHYRASVPFLMHIEVVGDTTVAGIAGKLISNVGWEFTDSAIEFRWRQLIVDEGSRLSVFELTGAPSLVHGLLKHSAFDTGYFFDRVTFAINPLDMGVRFNIRDTSDRFFVPTLEREYLGHEMLEWGGVKWDCKIFNQDFLMGIKGKSWIATIGLIKAQIDYEVTPWYDTSGVVADTVTITEKFDLVALNPSQELIEAKKAAHEQAYINTFPESTALPYQ
jgi:hypothetical protein